MGLIIGQTDRVAAQGRGEIPSQKRNLSLSRSIASLGKWRMPGIRRYFGVPARAAVSLVATVSSPKVRRCHATIGTQD
jgi:hypothetical protein